MGSVYVLGHSCRVVDLSAINCRLLSMLCFHCGTVDTAPQANLLGVCSIARPSLGFNIMHKLRQ